MAQRGGLWLDPTANAWTLQGKRNSDGTGNFVEILGPADTDHLVRGSIIVDAASNTVTAVIDQPSGTISASASFALGRADLLPVVVLSQDNRFGWTGLDMDNMAVAVPIPEPLTLLAVGMGVAMLGGHLRKRRMT